MKHTSKLNRFRTPLSLVLLAGMIPVATASAQFVQEDKTPTVFVHADHTGDEHVRSQWSQTISTGDRLYELDFADGVFIAKVDHEEVPNSWIHENPTEIQIIDDNGKEVVVFKNVSSYQDLYSGHVFPVKNTQALAWVSGNDYPAGMGSEMVQSIEQPKVMLGINLSEPSDALRKHLQLGDRQAILIDGVIEGLPAQKAGMEEFDVIISIDGSDEANGDILHEALMEREAGDTLKVVVMRAGKTITLKPELAAYDGELLGAIAVKIEMNEDGTETSWFSNGNSKTRVLVERLTPNKLNAKVRVDLHERLLKEAENAMSSAQRHAIAAQKHVIELRDGQLFVREQKMADLQEHYKGLEKLKEGHWQELSEGAHGRLEVLEDRLNTLEDQLEAQADRLEERMEQLTGLLERMFEKLSEDDD